VAQLHLLVQACCNRFVGTTKSIVATFLVACITLAPILTPGVDAQTTGDTWAVNRSKLQFGALFMSFLFRTTPPQSVRLTFASPAATWTATASAPWISVSQASGTGNATIQIGVRHHSSLNGPSHVEPAAKSFTGTVVIASNGTPSTRTVTVILRIEGFTSPSSLPYGVFDYPAGDSTPLAGSVALSGWALDPIVVDRVELFRDLQPGETTPTYPVPSTDARYGKIFIANATFVEDARPDVEMVFPDVPLNYRAGWGYLLLTWGLPNQGNGTYKLYAFAFNNGQGATTIGTKTVVISNNTATKPFGSIDTPGMGADASGPNFGWALTPKVNGVATCKIPPNGVQVSIDSGSLQPVVYGDNRTDVASAFPGFSNSDAAGGHFIFDWSTLTPGPHTIGWLVTDDCNRADGVGSRFFNVAAGSNLVAAPASARLMAASQVAAESESNAPVTLARGYGELPVIIEPGIGGSRTIEIKPGERIELRTPRGFEIAYQLGGREKRPLPLGSSWDAPSGTFSWQPAPGFLGRFRLVFSNGRERISVRVVVLP
jgi:hypothetical protein